MEQFEYKGTWYFPSDPEQPVLGIIRFHRVDRAVLEVLGNIPGRIPFEFLTSMGEVIDVIWGYTEKGDSLTLYKCVQLRESTSVGYIGSTFKVYAVFFNCHFENNEDLFFDSIVINYSGLAEWVGVSGFSGKITSQEGNNFILSEAEAQYRLPEQLHFRINNFIVSITFQMDSLGDNFSDVHLMQKTFLEITPDTPMHFNNFQAILYLLRNFVSLGIGAAAVPLVVKGRRKECSRESSKGESVIQDIYMYYVAKGSLVSEKKRKLDNILFRYVDVVENFQSSLQNWFTKSEQMYPVLDLYFGLFYIPEMYVHLELLTLAQALETYHSRMYGGMYLSYDEYEPILEKLVEAIPENISTDHRKSLINGLTFGYQYKLRRRIKLILRDVLRDYKVTVDKIVPNQEEFINQLVDTRNYLTHYTKALEERAITDPTKQQRFVERMMLIMQLCFFVEMEIPPETVKQLIRNNNRFRYWIG